MIRRTLLALAVACSISISFAEEILLHASKAIVHGTMLRYEPETNKICLGYWTKPEEDRKSTRLNSSHSHIAYAVFCLRKKNNIGPHARSDVYEPATNTWTR